MVTKKRIGKAKMSSNPKRYEVQWNKVDSSGNRARKKYTEDTIRHLTTSSKFAHCPNTTFLPKNFCTVLYQFPKGAKNALIMILGWQKPKSPRNHKSRLTGADLLLFCHEVNNRGTWFCHYKVRDDRDVHMSNKTKHR